MAKQNMVVTTTGGRRIRLDMGVEYPGGFDFTNPDKNQVLLHVIVDDRADTVVFNAGTGFTDRFEYRGHTTQPELSKADQVRRPRITKNI